MNPINGGWVILLTLLFALVLSVFRLPDNWPDWLAWFRPSWVLIVLFFWVMELPHRLGLISAWLIGLLMDGLLAQPLGLNGFILASFTYITWRFFERLRMFSVVQQGGVLVLLILGAEVLRGLMLNLSDDLPFSFVFVAQALVSMLLWPFVYLFLMRLRTAARVE